MTDCWSVRYRKGDYQTVHNHKSWGFSLVLYVEYDPKVHTPTTFVCPWQDPRTDTKSANRVIDSLISGKFVITTPLASYEEFAPYTWQGDYIEGIKWACDNPDQVINMIAAGQQYTEQNYSARVLSKQLIDEVERQLNSKET
jgi:hypothetical protein